MSVVDQWPTVASRCNFSPLPCRLHVCSRVGCIVSHDRLPLTMRMHTRVVCCPPHCTIRPPIVASSGTTEGEATLRAESPSSPAPRSSSFAFIRRPKSTVSRSSLGEDPSSQEAEVLRDQLKTCVNARPYPPCLTHPHGSAATCADITPRCLAPRVRHSGPHRLQVSHAQAVERVGFLEAQLAEKDSLIRYEGEGEEGQQALLVEQAKRMEELKHQVEDLTATRDEAVFKAKKLKEAYIESVSKKATLAQDHVELKASFSELKHQMEAIDGGAPTRHGLGATRLAVVSVSHCCFAGLRERATVAPTHPLFPV